MLCSCPTLLWRLSGVLIIGCLGYVCLYHQELAETTISIFNTSPICVDTRGNSSGSGLKDMRLVFNPSLTLRSFNRHCGIQLPGEPNVTTDWGVPWMSHPKLPRAISFQQYKEHLELLSTFSKIMAAENITYIMCDGTLLGSFMMHDMIPWDNDLDVMVSWKEMPKTLNVFRRITKEGRGFEAMNYQVHVNKSDFKDLEKNISYPTDVFHKFKFFRSNSSKAGAYQWRWPFIDIKFFNENDTHIWPVDYANVVYHTAKQHFYPLHLRPFGNLWLPSPADTRRFLQNKFKTFRCCSSNWNHETERGQKPAEVSCGDVKAYYPVVHRSAFGQGTVETLKLDKHVVQSLLVDEPFYSLKTSLQL